MGGGLVLIWACLEFLNVYNRAIVEALEVLNLLLILTSQKLQWSESFIVQPHHVIPFSSPATPLENSREYL